MGVADTVSRKGDARMRKHSLVHIVVLSLIVAVMLVLAAPAMAQSRSHSTGYYGPGGVSTSHRIVGENGDVRGDSYYRDWRGVPEYHSYHYNNRGYYNLSSDPDGVVARLGTYGRHSMDLTIDTHRPSWLRDRWRNDDYVPYSLRRDWRLRPIHQRYDGPPVILRADPPSSTPRPIFSADGTQLLNAEDLPEPPHGIEVHHLGG